MKLLPIGVGRKLKDGNDIAVISIGPIGNLAAKAIAEVEKSGHSIAHYDIIFLKPIDTDLLKEVASKFKKIMTIENGVTTGGLGSAVLEYLADNKVKDIEVTRIGLPDGFVTHGSIKELYHLCEIDAEGIAKHLNKALEF